MELLGFLMCLLSIRIKIMKKLFQSPRFLAVLTIGLLQALVLFNVISGEQGEGLILIIQGIIGSAVVVRTVDRNSDRQVESVLITTGLTSEEAKKLV